MKLLNSRKGVFILILFLLPILVYAANPFTPFWEAISCDGPDCQFCHAVQGLNIIIDFLIYAGGLIATALVLWVGFLFLTSGGSTSQREKAKKILWNAVIGLVITMSAYLIVDLVISSFINPKFEARYGSWRSGLRCVPVVERPVGNRNLPPEGDGNYTHEEAMQILERAGITVTSTNGIVRADCTGISGCTSLEGIRYSTLNQLVQMKLRCGSSCDVIVTGGTEGGHATGNTSHGSGFKIDVQDTQSVNNFIQTNPYFTRDGSRLDPNTGRSDPRWIDSCRNEYVREPTHWDITVGRTC